MCSRSVEVRYAGSGGLTPDQTGYLEHGCCNRRTIAKADNRVFWVDENGVAQVATRGAAQVLSQRWIDEGLSLDVDGVTIRGAGMDATILDFSNQQGAGEGLLVTSDKVTLEDFAVENSTGDGIKTKGSDIITFRRLRVEWTGGPAETNGAKCECLWIG